MPYRTWASLEKVDPAYGDYFDRVIGGTGEHGVKLNRLASRILEEADDDDLLMFLDGDAFPVADLGPLIASGLADSSLLAVQRVENANDRQPHPCFCVTRGMAWRDLSGDWRSLGPSGPIGERDVGQRLLQRLEATGTPWTPVLRTNRRDLHPVFFGVYGGVVYHHGAGFRRLALSRADLAPLRSEPDRERARARAKSTADLNRRKSEELFRRIQRDDPTWLAELT